MAIKITRRDLLNGMAVGAGGILVKAYAGPTSHKIKSPSNVSFELRSPAANYPPTLTGLRGSHEGSFEVAHALAWQGEKPEHYETLDEHYDLVVVGAGMSGLAAAWYYRRKMGSEAKILLLDNHDDFGGHAKRNEFHHEGRMVLGNGGAQQIDSPNAWSESSRELLLGLGIDQRALDQMDENTPDDYVLGGNLSADFGMTVPGPGGYMTISDHWFKFMHGRGDYKQAIRSLPVPEDQQQALIHFVGGDQDYLNDLSLTEKYDYVKTVSYNRFLSDRVGLDKDTLPLLDNHLRNFNGASGWNHSVFEALSAGAPGLRSMGWVTNLMDSVAAMFISDIAEIRMFPDGNSSVARLMIQQLIPSIAPGMKGFEDVAVTRFDYGALDRADANIRMRLSSTVVGVRENRNQKVEVDYVQHGRSLRVSADHCILACYNNLIPHLCPEMSSKQKEALSYGVRVPFVYANVLVKDGKAFSGLGVSITQCPYDPFQWVSSAPPMTTGGYEPPRNLLDPMAIFMMSAPTPAVETDADTRELYRAGRHKIYSTTFDQYEQEIRLQLQSMLGQYGFDHESDILAITVNRIPHGYAYFYHELDDPEWEEGKAPHEIGRQKFGRISIANSDSEARPYMDAAFDAAWRAVQEQS